ncbi:proprotein convertase P-domain-containing protein [Dactylosporangium sp. NPDC005572]|uniref:proprotein convertase P-domain-containing protein n=1 Tax=Dactylosporangium sp. NPDC005572 TaxID=3156889 RepID=UPI0033B0F4D2
MSAPTGQLSSSTPGRSTWAYCVHLHRYQHHLLSESRNGTWRLRLQDASAADSGFVNAWTLTV